MDAEPYSDKIDIFNKHRRLFDDVLTSKEEKVLQIAHADWININLLKDMADKLSERSVQFVVTMWAEGIEIRRMNTTIDKSLFYEFVQPILAVPKQIREIVHKDEKIVDIFKCGVGEYLNKDLQKVRTYCGFVTDEMRAEKLIPRSWLTLRLNGNKLVKHIGIDKCFTILETLGCLERVQEKIYGKSATFYRIKFDYGQS